MNKEEEAFNTTIETYRKIPYEKLEGMAKEDFSATDHPLGEDGIQVGVRIYYDDTEKKTIRCVFSLYTLEKKWWQLWDSPAVNESFIMAPDGTLVDE